MDGADQLEVSEWTLPGPSVGEVTEEGVGASCQPPFAFHEEKAKRQNDEVYISKHNAHPNEKTCAKRNRNESDYNEFPHYKHTFAESESQSEAVKRNDIMLHIMSHSESFPERDFQKTDDGGINYCKLSHWLKE